MARKPNYDIHERIFKFVVDVIKFVNKLPKTPANANIVYQVIKSVTSMGANDQEADGAITKKEFIHRYGIVRKEGKETCYWLRLIGAINPKFQKGASKLQIEGGEIVAIVSSILYKTSKKTRVKG